MPFLTAGFDANEMRRKSPVLLQASNITGLCFNDGVPDGAGLHLVSRCQPFFFSNVFMKSTSASMAATGVGL